MHVDLTPRLYCQNNNNDGCKIACSSQHINHSYAWSSFFQCFIFWICSLYTCKNLKVHQRVIFISNDFNVQGTSSPVFFQRNRVIITSHFHKRDQPPFVQFKRGPQISLIVIKSLPKNEKLNRKRWRSLSSRCLQGNENGNLYINHRCSLIFEREAIKEEIQQIQQLKTCL